MALAYSTGYLEPYYTGAGSALVAGNVYPVSLGGMAYELDTSDRYIANFVHASIPQQRASFDDRENVGRGTLNPEAFWRRTFESWHVGAGQTHFDRVDDSNPWRFRRSRGVDVWDRYQISLLPDVDGKAISGATNLFLAVAGSNLYLTDGTVLRRTTDITAGTPTFTTVTGTPATAATSIASDGFNVLTAHGTDGIYKTTRGAASTASNITGTVTHVAYGKGRWIAAQANNLYDVTTLVAAGGALPAALFTSPNTDFTWNCFAEGPTALYVGGFSGDKSLIYQLTLKDDGTGLNQPVVAGFLPDGEIIQAMQGYLGFVLIGTSKGVRVGIVGSSGDLTIGAFIPTDQPVLCFEGQERFVWFGWSGFEGTHSGLGRIDMETFSDVEAFAPAYASDIMFATTNAVLSVATFQGLRVYTVAAGAVLAEDPNNLVASGEIDSGLFDFGLTDEKVSLFIDMSHVHHGGSHSVSLSVDRGPFGHLATMEDDHFPIATGESRGREFEIRVGLTRDAVDPEMGPVIRSWALRAQPAAPVTEEITVPLRIGPVIQRRDGMSDSVDSVAQVENIAALCASKEVVSYTEGERGWSVIVTDYQFDTHDVWVGDDAVMGVKGTAIVRMKTAV
jgi:hypothetical protein